MCGIAGIYNFKSNKTVFPEEIKRMNEAIRHRGPDGEGVWARANIGLGHRRLEIVDLSDNGIQPIANEKNTMYIYLRMLLGVVLLLSFLIAIVKRGHNSYFSKMIFIVYSLLFISAFLGVSFERYFIAVYPLILQFSFSAIVKR